MSNRSSPEALPTSTVDAIRFRDGVLYLLDQRLLPHEKRWLECHSAEEAARAISHMVVRGAPAIGIAAAYGMALAAAAGADLASARQRLATSRPTAVNLHWALARISALPEHDAASVLVEAQRIHSEDRAQNMRMADIGVGLLPPDARVLTHCNTGALATGGHGTALGVIRTGWSQGRIRTVYHTETRPWMQGARLTAWELAEEGIPAVMLVEAAAASLMAGGSLDWVIIGADRVAANGDTANKVGTLMLAACARRFGVKVMVVAPSGTIDPDCPDGGAIPIEERDGDEVCSIGGTRLAPEGTCAWNPVFDITPASMIDAFVCEKGMVSPCAGEAPARFCN